MDTMAFVEDSLKSQGIDYTPDQEENEKIVSTALASEWPRLGTYVPLSTPLKDICSDDYIPTKEIVDFLSCECDLFLEDDEIDDNEQDTGYYTRTSSICFAGVRKVRNKFIDFIKNKYNLSLSIKDVDGARTIAELIELVDAAVKGKK